VTAMAQKSPCTESQPATGENSPNYRLDQWGSGIAILLSAVALQRSVSYGLKGTSQVIGPGMFPAIVSGVLLVLALIWALQAFRHTVAHSDEPVVWPDRGGVLRIAVTVAAMLLPALAFDLLDFRLTIFAICFVILRFVFGSTWLMSIAVGVGLSALAYFGLSVGLGLRLPLSF
jgi:hypothetical protein